jgi:hypothetical protein
VKVSVEAKALYNLYDVLNSMKASQSNIIKIARDMVSDLLPVLDVDGTALENKINQEISDSAWNFVKGTACPDTSDNITDEDRKWADEEIRRLRKLAYEKRPAPDPRCDGCEYQHPYAENLSYDVIAGKVYCNRGTRPPYYKEGRTIKYPDNLMICGVYYLEDGILIKFFKPEPYVNSEKNIQAIKESLTKNSCNITVSSIPQIQNLIDLELINHRAILQILDIMMNSTCNRGWNRDTEMRTQIKELHKQLRGIRYELQ